MKTEPCQHCQQNEALDFAFTMAFQPIVDIERREVFAYEALVRGMQGEGAGQVLARVDDANRYHFDQACRILAVEWAARLGVTCYVSINFLPNAVYQPATCIRATLAAAKRHAFPTDQLIFEVAEQEQVRDRQHLQSIFTEYKRQGFLTAIDDFGAGYAGLSLLAEFQPDLVKLDLGLIRGIHQDRVKQAIVHGNVGVCRELGITVIAEGVETREELEWLRQCGIRHFQGFLFARPAIEALPEIHWP